MVPKHILDDGNDFNKHEFGRHPIGTGPFKFKEWKTGRKIVVEKNENYWGEEPKLAGITFKIISDSGTALQVLKKHEIDVASLTNIQWVKQTESKNFNGWFDKYKYYSLGYYFIAWNNNRPYFQDKNVRRAMTMMVNREKIIEKLYYGLAETVTGETYKYGPDYDLTIEPVPYDPETAVELLEAAGWVDTDSDGIRDKDGIPFSFTFMTTASKASERLTNILREDLREIGIDMDISKFEWVVFGKNLNDRAFDVTMLGWTGILEADPYQVWHSSQVEKGSNFVGFKHDEADSLIERGRREFDAERRHEIYKAFHRILHEEQPYTFLYMLPNLIAVQKRFTDVKVYKLGVDIKEWGVSKPQHLLYQ